MSTYSTRSQKRREEEARLLEERSRAGVTVPVADSGLASDVIPMSPSLRSVHTTQAGAVTIPVENLYGRVFDHSRGGDGGTTSGALPPPGPGSTGQRAPSIASTMSTRAREALRARIEYEAECELHQAHVNMVKKKKAMQLAELDAEEEAEKTGEVSAQRIDEWLDKSPFAEAATPTRTTATELVEKEGRSGVNIERQPPAALVEHEEWRTPHTGGDGPAGRTVSGNQERRDYSFPREVRFEAPQAERRIERAERPDEQKNERRDEQRNERRDTSRNRSSRAIDELAEALQCLTRQQRPTPRAFYELPTFSGDSTEWLLFKKKYEDTTQHYKYTAQENIYRLQTAVQGRAKNAIEDLLRTSADPAEIITTLERAFGSPSLLLQGALKKIRSLPRVSDNDAGALRMFSATVRSCVSTLKNIRADGYLNNPQLVREVLDKLSPAQRMEYSKFARDASVRLNTDLRVSPTLTVLVEFLDELADIAGFVNNVDVLAPAHAPRPRDRQPALKQVHQVREASETTVQCPLCNEAHKLTVCPKFGKLDVSERWDFVKENRLCFKCIVKKHSKFVCKAKKCAKCNYGHHLLLHTNKTEAAVVDARSVEPTPSTSTIATETVTNIGQRSGKALLKVVPVTVSDRTSEVETFALLDDGASVSIVNKGIVKNAIGRRIPLNIISASGHSVTDKDSRSVNVRVRGPSGEWQDVSVRTMADFKLPPQSVSAAALRGYQHLSDLPCGELREATPQLLIGQDNWELIVGEDLRRGKSGQPVASLTKLGWVIHGPINNNSSKVESVCHLRDLDNLIRDQFELDSLGVVERPRSNLVEARAVEILDSTSRQLLSKQWEVGLLWRTDDVTMPDNRRNALSRLHNVERKMDRDANYARLYCAQIDRLVDNGYAKVQDTPIEGGPEWFLPHFGVTNVNKPGKLRLVFDAAATFKGTSLNDKLVSGPDLLNSLLGVLFKFRSKPVAVTADIADMFLRIKIIDKDQGAQMFLWRGMKRDVEPTAYVMNSMIFGAASSPTSAIYVLNKNAQRFANEFPDAVDAVLNRHYMDDYLDSLEDTATAVKRISDLTHIHAEGNFNIRGWASNDPEVRRLLPEILYSQVDLTKLGGNIERTLGLIWHPDSDDLSFDVTLKRLRPEVANGTRVPTKREFLSAIMSVFDPLGLLCPILIESRMIMQKVWKSGIGWDEKLNSECFQEWLSWLSRLASIARLRIPRFYNLDYKNNLSLHVFGDASEQAYAAVAYLVDVNCNVALVAAKARVAPVKLTSMPRLELQAALLACRLAQTVKNEHALKIDRIVYWSDSMTVLRWIRSEPQAYKPFVAHRLAEIDVHCKVSDWHWVPSSENPADECTRPQWNPERSMWLSGPRFICRSEGEWPRERGVETSCADPELRASARNVHVVLTAPPPLVDIGRFSTWTRAIRAVARVLAFVQTLRDKQRIAVSASLVERAEATLLRQSQQSAFPVELAKLKKGEPVQSTSRLVQLDPMLSDDGLIRVRGRLLHADVSFQAKHPIILDGKDEITRLLIKHCHAQTLHGNPESVVNELRQRYCVLRIRPAVKYVEANCQYCRNMKAKSSAPKMADLPDGRLQHHQPAFSHCGLDYFGPMEVVIGRRREKRWGVLFTCLTVRAIHLEIAASLSADSAIMALRRFIARRGQPAAFYSDRGTNFVGASTELKAAWQAIEGRMADELATRRIDWRFISPASPHMGGAWERMVRSVKTALKVTLKEKAPKEETLQTLFAEVEAVVNCRPLTHVPVNPNDPVALTPNHLLLGTGVPSSTLGTFDHSDLSARKQWQVAQALADLFWRRWVKEYLPTLQRRRKWNTEVQPVKEGDVVVVADPNLPRNVWPKGRIVKVFRGKDNQVRVVNIRQRPTEFCVDQ